MASRRPAIVDLGATRQLVHAPCECRRANCLDMAGPASAVLRSTGPFRHASPPPQLHLDLPARRAPDGRPHARRAARGQLCCHCLLRRDRRTASCWSTPASACATCATPRRRLSGFFLALLSPEFREEMTAVRQIERLGLRRRATCATSCSRTSTSTTPAGSTTSRSARVHMLRRERDHAVRQKTWLDRQRFRPQQWSRARAWQVHERRRRRALVRLRLRARPRRPAAGDPAGAAARPHARPRRRGGAHTAAAGCCRPATPTSTTARWTCSGRWCTPGLRFYQTMMEKDRSARLGNQQRLRELRAARRRQCELFCAHDPVEFERLSGRPMQDPSAARSALA